jgi:hypothetical protein
MTAIMNARPGFASKSAKALPDLGSPSEGREI